MSELGLVASPPENRPLLDHVLGLGKGISLALGNDSLVVKGACEATLVVIFGYGCESNS
jgi:hypothetical protein